MGERGVARMQFKVVVITSHFLRDFSEDLFAQLDADCVTQIVEYRSFGQILGLYRRYEAETDAFMISGSAALATLTKQLPEGHKPVYSYHTSDTSFYHAIARVLVEHRDLDPDRVLLDFSIPMGRLVSVGEFVRSMDMKSLGKMVNGWLGDSSVADIECVEDEVLDECTRLYRAGEVDYVLCSFSSIVPALEERGVPFAFLYPDREQVAFQLRELRSQLQIEQLRQSLPAAIAIAPREGGVGQGQTTFASAVRHVLKDMAIASEMVKEDDICSVGVTHRTVMGATDQMGADAISAALEKGFGINAAVGYGVGKGPTEANRHAVDALRESRRSTGSFVLDENECLRGPLGAGRFMDVDQKVTDRVRDIAKECHLSTLTIQKLRSILWQTGSSEVTTGDLAEHLGVTTRNANRILRGLESGGVAEVTHSRTTKTKGRPVKVYRLRLD